MNNVTRINWSVLVYLTIWCWVDGFTTTAFGLTVLILTEALWKPFGSDTMDLLNKKGTTCQ